MVKCIFFIISSLIRMFPIKVNCYAFTLLSMLCQIKKAKCFHEIFFNGLFGRLAKWSKAEGKREFLLQNETSSLWIPSNLYLLLPLENLNDINKGSLKINWTGINSCASAIEFVRTKYSLGAEHCDSDGKNLSLCDTSSSEAECDGTKKIHFANCVLDITSVKDMAVLAIHTGRMYCIIEASQDLSAESPFDGTSEKLPAAERMTFSGYFSKRCCFILN